jgi:hypothetical protein
MLSYAKKWRRSSGASGALGQELRGRLRTSVKLGLHENRPEMDRRKKIKEKGFLSSKATQSNEVKHNLNSNN